LFVELAGLGDLEARAQTARACADVCAQADGRLRAALEALRVAPGETEAVETRARQVELEMGLAEAAAVEARNRLTDADAARGRLTGEAAAAAAARAAVDELRAGGAPSGVWAVAFEAAESSHPIVLQHLLLGMNAHINRELPEGIVATYLTTGGAPLQSGARYDDFRKVNDLLEAVEADIKVEFSTGIIAVVDAAGGEVDDAVAMWKVRAAREAAWTHAEVLWALRAMPTLRNAFFTRLDGLTGFAGRGLLLTSAARGGTRPSHGRYPAAHG
jgi:hypothetical protein